jgi:hypothetical protein
MLLTNGPRQPDFLNPKAPAVKDTIRSIVATKLTHHIHPLTVEGITILYTIGL